MHREPTATRVAESGRLTGTILEAVADARDCRVADLDARLYDVVDPDCLERLFRRRADGTPRDGGRVVFSVGDCDVTVRSDRSVAATYHPETDARPNPVAAPEE